MKLQKEIQQLQRRCAASTTYHFAGKKDIISIDDEPDADFDGFDPSSPLSMELQLHPWPANYKPKMPAYNGRTNPKKFIANYETAIYSAGGDANTLAKSLILSMEDIASGWYGSLKPLSIKSWPQLKADLLANFEGFHLKTKTTRDVLNCVQKEGESLAEYLERFIQVKAQVPNIQDETVIAAATEGLAIG